jgi:hypothetical protein
MSSEMEIVIKFHSPYIYVCAECQNWWVGMDEFRKEPNPHYGHSILPIKVESIKQEDGLK